MLSLWDAYTLTPVWNWPSLPVEQFVLTTEADSPSSVTWYVGGLVSSDFHSPKCLSGLVQIIYYVLCSKPHLSLSGRGRTDSLFASFYLAQIDTIM